MFLVENGAAARGLLFYSRTVISNRLLPDCPKHGGFVNGERRAASRYELALHVRYREGCVGLTRNIGASGVYFATDRAERVGDSFMLEVDLADTTIRCEGRVVRVEPFGSAFGVALEFTMSRLEMKFTETTLQPDKDLSMKRGKCLSVLALGATFLAALALSAPAFAAKDVLYPSGASANVGGTSVTPTNNFSTGADGHITLDGSIAPASAVSVSVTWSIQDRSGSGTSTVYPRTVMFTASTTVTPGPTVTPDGLDNCTLTSNSGSCSTVISFTAPATDGSYQLKVQAADGGSPPANIHIEGRAVFVNFTVATPVSSIDTQLTVGQQCFLLNGGYEDLTANLVESGGGAPVPGAGIDFFIDPELDGYGYPTDASVPVGSATTNASGTATLVHNIDGLGVGDHVLYAEFPGSGTHNPSNDSATLGISYLFVGFQPPINPEGNSVFGNGRVIPVKIRLRDANLNPVIDAAPTVWFAQYSEDTGLGEVLEPATSVSAADTGNVMRYVPADDQYMYNWDLSSLTNGTYAVVVDLNDSPTCSQGPHQVIITVSKKGNKK